MGDRKEAEDIRGGSEEDGDGNNFHSDVSDDNDGIDEMEDIEKENLRESTRSPYQKSKELSGKLDHLQETEPQFTRSQSDARVFEYVHHKLEPEQTKHVTKPQPSKPQPTKPRPTKPQPTKPQPTKPQPLKSEIMEAQPSKRFKWWCFPFISATLVTILILYFLPVVLDDENTTVHNYNHPDIFIDKLVKVQKDFPNQNEIIWNMIRNGGRRHLAKLIDGSSKEKLTPQSYLIAGYSGSSDTVECFVSELAESFTEPPADLQQRIINSATFSQDKDVGILYTALESRLNTSNKLVIVKDIDKLPYSVASLFMSFTDEHNTVASYPQSILFLTTVLPFPFDSLRSRQEDEGRAAEHFKSNIWGDVPSYKKDPLWSRVGDGIILIKKEEVNPCNVAKEDL